MEIAPEVLDWLLEDENPSIQYRTLTELLDKGQDDPGICQAKARIVAYKPVVKIFQKMAPEGYWLHRGEGAGVGYAMSSSTHFVLSFLAELGMDHTDERVARAVERYLSLTEPDVANPAPWQIPPDFRNQQSCLYAYNLRTFVMLGYRYDPRIEERVQVLLMDKRFDGGTLCRRSSFNEGTKSCYRGSLKALTAFAALPELWHTPRCQQLVDYFLGREVLFQQSHPETPVRGEVTTTIFPFVISASLLEPLVALSSMGYGDHPALVRSWQVLETKKDREGRFMLDWHPPTIFDPGPKGEANKWVTFYAYLALRLKDRPLGRRRAAVLPSVN